jgi:hypothetical protein
MLFLLILPLGSDLHFHIYRIGAMARELKMTGFNMPVRILSESYNGYGYGVPLFYGDTLLYIPAFMVVLGMGEVLAYKLLLCMIFLLTFASMYWQMYRSSGKSDFSFMCAAFYSFSAYFLTDLCIRASVGEAMAFIFLPFVFCSFYNMIYNPVRYDWFFLTVGMSGLILSHNLTTIFTAVVLVIWALVKFKELVKNHSIGKILIAAATTIGITASFVFPMIEAMLVQKYQTAGNNEYQMQEFTKHTLDLIDFFFPYELKKIISVVFDLGLNTDVWHPGAVGIFLVLIFILIFLTRNIKKKRVLNVIFALSVMIYGYMFIEPFVTWSGKFISFMQFEWRLLTFCTFGFSVYAAYLLELSGNIRLKRTYIILAILIGLYSIGSRYAYQAYLDYRGMDYIKEINNEYYKNYVMEYNPNDGDNMYLPQGVLLSLYEDRGEVVKCNHEDVKFDFYREDAKIIINVEYNPYDDTTLELPLYYYKGYSAVGNDEYSVKASDNKLVEIEIKEKLDQSENESIEVWYAGTLIQKVSNWISVMSIILLAVYIISRKTQLRQQGGIAA